MVRLLWISPQEALSVVIATTGMYVAMVLMVRLLGPRILARLSSFDMAAVIAFGAVIGRAALGDTPRFGGGLVALGTLVALQVVAGRLRRVRWGDRALMRHAVLLMAGSVVVEENLHRSHITASDLQTALREAGVRRPSEVAAVVFEPTGKFSVMRRGAPIDPMLLSGVVGAALVPARFLGAPEAEARGMQAD
ncbi:hypothetical protein N864_14360 [Intrasporangium chromatireducens Q5-1]|uniref:YetF C-terminal domain-containing protein n=1 Tax=Intrasporangium chromatireducens Q5-1 TaxID=584657 RepID=W9GPX5_9MICO|nr:YetF domain-containing protein [Intrasporangium chromatireducens]EWT06883.1 hypothetical protein N864_14360 [Intrasporangium chromatireducens Q5-1]